MQILKKIVEQNITLPNGSIVPTKYYVPLKININDSCNIYEKSYIINQDNPYFDIIFGRSIQKKYKLLIDQFNLLNKFDKNYQNYYLNLNII